MTHAIFRGWTVASMASSVELLGSGRVIDANVKVRVEGNRHAGDVLGNPFLAWSPLSLMDDRMRALAPGENLPLWTGLNDYDRPYMKTIGLFLNKESDDDPEAAKAAMEFTFIVCALRMIWGYRSDIGHAVSKSYKEFCVLAGIPNPNAIWGEGKWKTLPDAPVKSIKSLTGEWHEIGRVIRMWHDEIFSKFRMVEAWPVAAHKDEEAPFQSLIDRGAEVRNILATPSTGPSVYGGEIWRDLSRDDLERLVWTVPRKTLAGVLEVSDMAIIKRCKREQISQPPRGFWQKVDKATSESMTLFLLKNNVSTPIWWDVSISRNRDDGGVLESFGVVLEAASEDDAFSISV